MNNLKCISAIMLCGVLFGSCSNRETSSSAPSVKVFAGASSLIKEVKLAKELTGQHTISDMLAVTPLAPPPFQATYKLDLREKPFTSLSPYDREQLQTASGVEVTLSDGRAFRYNNAEGNMLFEGDIAVSLSKNVLSYLIGLETGTKKLGQQGMLQTNLWPNNTIYYYWNRGAFGANHEATIKKSMELWNQVAGGAVKWVWNPNASSKVQLISSSTACGWSYVGRVGGTQKLGLNPRCNSTHTTIHEMGHAAGMWHEHQRCDRDQFVSLRNAFDKVNFGKTCRYQSSTFGAFDYDSVMNYGSPYVYAKRASGNYQGNPRNLGRVPSLSKGDIEAIWRMYRKTSSPTNGGGGTTPSPTRPNPTNPNTGGMKWTQGPTYQGQTVNVGSVQYAPASSGFQVIRPVEIYGHLAASYGNNYELFLLAYNGQKWSLAGQGNAGNNSQLKVSATKGIIYRWAIRNNVGTGTYKLDVKVGENTGSPTRPSPETGGTNGGGFDTEPTNPTNPPKPQPTRPPTSNAPAITHVNSSNWSTMMSYSNDRLVIIDVGAPAWCRPCQQLEPYIKSAAQRSGGRWVLGLLNIDSGNNKSIASRLGANAYPTLVAIKNGRVIGKSDRVHAGNLNSWINQYLNY